MNRKKREWLLTGIGVLFILVGILALINTALIQDDPIGVLWMCYLSLLIMGYGVLRRSSFLVMSQIYILTLPVIIWNIDFFYQLLSGMRLWGITDYFFVTESFTIGQFVSLQHIYSVPLALFAVYLMKPTPRSDGWKLSLVQVTVMFFVTRALADPLNNINCVFYPCINVFIGLPHIVTWFIASFALIILTTILLHQLPFLRGPTKQRR